MLTRHLRLALKRLNHWITDKQLTEAIERMTSYMRSQTLMQINEEKYGYVRDGVPVTRLNLMAIRSWYVPKSWTLAMWITTSLSP